MKVSRIVVLWGILITRIKLLRNIQGVGPMGK